MIYIKHFALIFLTFSLRIFEDLWNFLSMILTNASWLVILLFISKFGKYFSTSTIEWEQLTQAPSETWVSIASDNRFSQFIATANNDKVYIALNSGAVWEASLTKIGAVFTNCDSSSDGDILCACGVGNALYCSTSGGKSWQASVFSVEPSPGTNWTAITCSSDGKYWTVASQSTGLMYQSNSSGYSWFPISSPVCKWMALVSADNNMFLAAASLAGAIYVSKDRGVTWSSTTGGLPSYNWTAMAIANNSVPYRLFATASDKGIYFSGDEGESWVLIYDSDLLWTSISCDSNGENVIAAGIDVSGVGYVHMSSDYGKNWLTTSLLSSWSDVVLSSNGSLAVGVTMADQNAYLGVVGNATDDDNTADDDDSIDANTVEYAIICGILIAILSAIGCVVMNMNRKRRNEDLNRAFLDSSNNVDEEMNPSTGSVDNPVQHIIIMRPSGLVVQARAAVVPNLTDTERDINRVIEIRPSAVEEIVPRGSSDVKPSSSYEPTVSRNGTRRTQTTVVAPYSKENSDNL